MRARAFERDEPRSFLEQLKNVETFPDGRKPLWELLSRFNDLESRFGFQKTQIYEIPVKTRTGEDIIIPIDYYLSPAAVEGQEMLMLMAGIHGEEPAPPIAVANQINSLGSLGQNIPLGIAPLINPAGYVKNWRFHDMPFSLERRNITDSRHLLPNRDSPSNPMLDHPVHGFAADVMNVLDALNWLHPFRLFVDLHEDALLEAGYLYSQGRMADRDPVALRAMQLMAAAGVKLKPDGTTRFPGERIRNGLVFDEKTGGPVSDGSVDQWAAANTVYRYGIWAPKPAAQTVIVPETPANENLSLADRVRAHEAITGNLDELWQISTTLPKQEVTTTERPNVIQQWLETGLADWEREATIDTVAAAEGVKIPIIYAPATAAAEGKKPQHLLVVSGMHLEETGGPKALLDPKAFRAWREAGISFTIIPVINQHGLQFPETAPEIFLRADSDGVNYNDCWGRGPHRTKESAALEKKIRRLHSDNPFDLVVSCHEDSTMPGKGYVGLQGLGDQFQEILAEQITNTPSGQHLADITPQTNPFAADHATDADPNLFKPGIVKFGWQMIDDYDATAFENWVEYDPQLQIPAVTVEGPFGLDLSARTAFQLAILGGCITALQAKT